MTLFTLTFAAAILLTTALRLWLTLRQIANVHKHRDEVPKDFAAQISHEEHRKAADYTIAKARLGLAQLAAGTALLLALIFGGGLQALDLLVQRFFAVASYPHGLALFAGFAVVGWLVELPFDIYRTFVVETRFGFNRMNLATYLADTGKGGSGCHCHRHAAIAGRALADGGDGHTMVVVGLAILAGLQPAGDDALSDADRAALQQVRAARRCRPARAYRSTAAALRLSRLGFVRHGRIDALQSRQCLLYRDGPQQADRLFRHAAGAPEH